MKGMKKAIVIVLAITAISVFCLSSASVTQAAWPEKSITLYIPYAAGGSMDSSIRALAPGMEKVLGQQIVLINKTGGGGTASLPVVAGSKPDGYTLTAATSSAIIQVPILRKVDYKPLSSFTNIFAYASPISGTVVRADAPWKTWNEFIEYSKANPGKIKYSTTGASSPMHIAMEAAADKYGVKWVHIPYKGSSPALTALLGKHVEACSSGGEFVKMAQSGQVIPLVVHSEKRMAQFPETPTIIELGIPFHSGTYFCIYGPAGMDPAVTKKIEDAVAYAVDTPVFEKMATTFALAPVKKGSAEFTKYLEEGWPKQIEVFKKLGMITEAATAPR